MKIIKWGSWDHAYDVSKLNYNISEVDCVIKEIREKHINFNASYHQYGSAGVPYFDDGKPFMLTQYKWAGLMYQIWGGSIEDYF